MNRRRTTPLSALSKARKRQIDKKKRKKRILLGGPAGPIEFENYGPESKIVGHGPMGPLLFKHWSLAQNVTGRIILGDENKEARRAGVFYYRPQKFQISWIRRTPRVLHTNNFVKTCFDIIPPPSLRRTQDLGFLQLYRENFPIYSDGVMAPPKGPTSKQIETRTKEGRRRITPLFLAPQPDLADTPLPFNSNIVSSSTSVGPHVLQFYVCPRRN